MRLDSAARIRNGANLAIGLEIGTIICTLLRYNFDIGVRRLNVGRQDTSGDVFAQHGLGLAVKGVPAWVQRHEGMGKEQFRFTYPRK